MKFTTTIKTVTKCTGEDCPENKSTGGDSTTSSTGKTDSKDESTDSYDESNTSENETATKCSGADCPVCNGEKCKEATTKETVTKCTGSDCENEKVTEVSPEDHTADRIEEVTTRNTENSTKKNKTKCTGADCDIEATTEFFEEQTGEVTTESKEDSTSETATKCSGADCPVCTGEKCRETSTDEPNEETMSPTNGVVTKSETTENWNSTTATDAQVTSKALGISTGVDEITEGKFPVVTDASKTTVRSRMLVRLRNSVILGDFQKNFRPNNRNFSIHFQNKLFRKSPKNDQIEVFVPTFLNALYHSRW